MNIYQKLMELVFSLVNVTLLGAIIDKTLNFKKHIGDLVRKPQYKLHALPRIRKFHKS